jgi:hypothetical protein
MCEPGWGPAYRSANMVSVLPAGLQPASSRLHILNPGSSSYVCLCWVAANLASLSTDPEFETRPGHQLRFFLDFSK